MNQVMNGAVPLTPEKDTLAIRSPDSSTVCFVHLASTSTRIRPPLAQHTAFSIYPLIPLTLSR